MSARQKKPTAEHIHSAEPMLESLEDRIAPAGLAFAISGGNSQNQTIKDIAVDPAGNSYVIGTFAGTVDFDPTAGVFNVSATSGHTDAFVAKYTDAGVPVWINTVRLSGENADEELHIAVNNLGEAFITSEFGITAQSGPLVTASFFETGQLSPSEAVTQNGPATGIYLAKINAEGHFDWATVYGGTTFEPIGSGVAGLETDSAGNIYLAGRLHTDGDTGTVNFNSFPITQQPFRENGFVVKLTDTGSGASAQWATSVTASDSGSFFYLSTFAVDSSGNVAVTGSVGGNNGGADVTFGPSTVTAIDNQDIVVAKMDSSGAWLWARTAEGGGLQDEGRGIGFDSAGSVYISGHFANTTDFFPGVSVINVVAPGATDVKQDFLWKLDSSGSFAGILNFGGTGDEEAGPLTVSANGNISFIGFFSGTVDFDPDAGVHSLTSTGTEDAFYLTIDPSFALVSVLRLDATFDSSGNGLLIDDGNSVAVGDDGSLYFGGTFRGSFDVDFGDGVTKLTSKGGSDFFVARLLPEDIVAQALEAPAVKDGFTFGGSGDQSGYQVITDAAGNLYVAGLFTGTVDFDPGTGVTALSVTDGSPDVFLAKYSSTNQLLWARQVQMGLIFDSEVEDVSIKLALDAAGTSVYLASEFNGGVLFHNSVTLTNADGFPGSRDVFISQFGSDGSLAWAHSLGGEGQHDLLDGIAVGASGQVAIIGNSRLPSSDFYLDGSFLFGFVENAGSSDNEFVIQFNSGGGLDWHRQLAGTDASTIYAGEVSGVAISGSDVIILGNFLGTIDFGLGGSADTATALTDSKLYVASLSGSTGTVNWHREFLSPGNHEGGGIGVNSAGEIIVAGGFENHFVADSMSGTTLLSAGGSDVFVLKLTSSGSFLGATSFGGAGDDSGSRLNLDAADNIYVAGGFGGTVNFAGTQGFAALTASGPGDLYMAAFASDLSFTTAYRVAGFDSSGTEEPNGPGIDFASGVDLYVDAQSNVYFTGGLSGSLDFDNGKAVKSFSSKGGLDSIVLKFTPYNIADASHIRSFNDADGDKVTIKLTGPGTATYTLNGNVGNLADLSQLLLEDTTIATTLTITVESGGSTTVSKILTAGTNEHVGSITLGSGIVLGSGTADTDTDLLVSGALKSLVLDDIAANTIISLGRDLPYNVTSDTSTPDTYNNKPTVTINDVLGAGVSIEVLSDTARALAFGVQGIGGGGLGNITIHSWAFDGSIKTTQSIGNLTVTGTDTIFLANLEIDRYSNGEETTANTGTISVVNGELGSTANYIEGLIAGIKVGAYSGSITAGSISSIAVQSSSSSAGAGAFTGSITLTSNSGSTSTALKFITTSGNFDGSVSSAVAVGNLSILGDFTGSLSAPSIGALKAYSFAGDGTHSLGGVDARNDIISTTGSIGALTATKGGFSNYEISAATTFGGLTASLSNLTNSTIGIENLSVTAFSIGNIAVTLKGKGDASYSLIGIIGSTFITTGTGTGTKASPAGNIGNISVTLAGSSGMTAAIGITGSTFDSDATGSTVNKIGAISVTLTSMAGSAVGIISSAITGDNLSTVKVSIAGAAALTNATGIGSLASFIANGSLATGTTAGNIDAVTVKVTGTTFLASATGFAGSLTSVSSSIGAVSISVQGSSLSSTGLGLVGILDGSIEAATTLGKVTVTAKNASTLASSASQYVSAIVSANQNVEISAGTAFSGLAVSATSLPGGGGNALTLATGFGRNISLDAGTDLGAITVGATKGKTGSSAQAFAGPGIVSIHADGKIASLTVNGDASGVQVANLFMTAGSSIGNVSVTSKTAANGSLVYSLIAAGQQAIDLTALTKLSAQQAELKKYALGNVTVSGSMAGTMLAAGTTIGTVKVGTGTTGDLLESFIVAGVHLNTPNPADLDNTYNRQAAIGAVTVAGALTQTSIAAGIDPVDAAWGNDDDLFADNLPGALAALIVKKSSIGKITVGATSIATGATQAFSSVSDMDLHIFAIVAESIAGMKAGTFTASIPAAGEIYLDGDTIGEQNTDIALRIGSASVPPSLMVSGGAGRINILFDFRYDTTGFFTDPDHRAILEAAAYDLASVFADDLADITPSGGNTWSAVFFDPSTGNQVSIPDMTIAEDTVVIFAGARDLAGSTLGQGGGGGFTSSGFGSWNDDVQGRGQAGATGSNATLTDFAPWGGAIVFDNATNWSFGNAMTGPGAGQSDFYTIASHELAHLFGFGTSASWNNLLQGGTFTGALTTAYFGSNVTVSVDQGHWDLGTEDPTPPNQLATMNPSILVGTRSLLTKLDYLGLDDIGWDVILPP